MKSFHYVFVLALVLAGCSKDIHNTDAVRQGIVDHLSSRQGLDLNMSAMEVEVTAVTFRENECDATVSFRPKGTSGAGMQMRYTLERSGNKWTVKNSSEANGGTPDNPHGMSAPPQGGDMPATGTLPPGHPPITPQQEPGAKQ